MKPQGNKLFSYFLIFFILIFTVFFIIKFKPIQNISGDDKTTIKTDQSYSKKLKLGDNYLRIDIADNPELTRIGLSGRQSMCEDCGMYFIFGYENTLPTFWMKDMHFPIDIIWIDDGKIVDITKNVPVHDPTTPDFQLPKYQPKQKIDNVLEVNAGYTDRNNVKEGDILILQQN